MMAGNLTGQVRNIAEVSTPSPTVTWSRKITVDVKGEIFGLKDTINNTMVDQLFVRRRSNAYGARSGPPRVNWCGDVEASPVRERFDRLGELHGVELDRPGAKHCRRDEGSGGRRLIEKSHRRRKSEIWELKNTINTMVDQLNSFAAE